LEKLQGGTSMLIIIRQNAEQKSAKTPKNRWQTAKILYPHLSWSTSSWVWSDFEVVIEV